jgi:hypothetical protein
MARLRKAAPPEPGRGRARERRPRVVGRRKYCQRGVLVDPPARPARSAGPAQAARHARPPMDSQVSAQTATACSGYATGCSACGARARGAPEHRPQRPQVQRLQPGLQLGAGGGGRQPVRLEDVRPVKHQPPVRRRRRAGPAVAARRGGRGRRGRLPGPSRGGAVSAPGRGRGCRAGLEHQAVQACVQVLPVPVCRCTAAACHALQ